MPRRPRVFVEGGIFHVYNRFARGMKHFADPEEAIVFLEILRKARGRGGLNVFRLGSDAESKSHGSAGGTGAAFSNDVRTPPFGTL